MIYFTRGSLGTHLFELAYTIGKNSIRPGTHILNFHSVRQVNPHACATKVSSLINNYHIHTFDVPSKRKQGCFRQPDFGSCIKNFFHITDGGFELKPYTGTFYQVIGHIRMPDKKKKGYNKVFHEDKRRDPFDLDTNYKKITDLMKKQKVDCILSNEIKLRTPKVGGDAILDFTIMANALNIFATYSQFSIATTLFKIKREKRCVNIFLSQKQSIQNEHDLQTILTSHIGSSINIKYIDDKFFYYA